MISPTAEYALRAVVALAQRADRVAVTRELAVATRIPAPYLSKILQKLARAELVLSQRGLRGGFRLVRPAEQVSVLEVVNAVEPLRRIRVCPLGIEAHGVNLCPLHRKIDDVLRMAEEAFDKTTIAELLAEDGPCRALCDPRAAPP